MCFDVRRVSIIEKLESRRLLAGTWSANAKLIDQDDAYSSFPTVTGAGVTVAVIDTGIDYNHPSLGAGLGSGHKVKGGHDFVDNDEDPMDTFGHGTRVAGIIAAAGFTFNGTYYQGIAPSASLVALRVAAGNEGVSDSRIEEAVKWVENNYQTYGISVVNISFGYSNYNSPFDNPTLSDDFQALSDLGILVVSSSGNAGGVGVNYPAADANVLAIGSVTSTDTTSSFSQVGSLLDLLAPGESVGSTSPNNTFTLGSGTSFSSPCVAGIAALIKQVNPSAKDADMLSILRASGARHDDTANALIYPRVDVYNAIALAQQRKADAASTVGTGGLNSDVAYDKQGILHLAYYEPATHTIRYATRSTSGGWSDTSLIDTSGHDVGAYLSLAIGPLGQPSVAYYDANVADLVYAHFDGKNWTHETLDSGKTVGQYASLAFSDEGDPIVAYYRKTSEDLRVMWYDASAKLWQRYFVETSGDVGRFASLAVSESGGVGVAYADVTNGNLKFARWNGSAWVPELVDDLQGVAFISLAFNSSSLPAISYYDAYPADLKFAQDDGVAWQAQTLGKSGAQGLYTSLWFDESDFTNIVYFNRKANSVFRLKGSVGNWTVDTVGVGGGDYATAAPTIDGTTSSYAWRKAAKNRLIVGDLG